MRVLYSTETNKDNDKNKYHDTKENNKTTLTIKHK